MPPKFMAAPLGDSDGDTSSSPSSSDDDRSSSPPAATKPKAADPPPAALALSRPDLHSIKQPSPGPGAWEWGGGGAASKAAEEESVTAAGREETRAAAAAVVVAAARAVETAQPKSFAAKEKRKRERGQQRGTNYVEDAKRQAREAGVYGFD